MSPVGREIPPRPHLCQQAGVLQLDRAGDEAHLTALLHQASDPPAEFVQSCILDHNNHSGSSYLFNVQEVFGFEGDGHALHGDVITGSGVVTHICPHGESNRFGLER
ncbi:hypothetical protein EYF80_003748 [Liparis tanakae]|uniref:Uncharacterized protein n=1 Tax=Liparis tanakae TaxID=230148 RepID=A0A4Z2J7L2_9TELE|nr:hypothetical protein EYF80_003748 [Liparis tanakae]